MRNRECPACHQVVPPSGLLVDKTAPRSFASAMPRMMCPHCHAGLRSSNRSLVPAVLLFVLGLALYLGSRLFPANLTHAAHTAGTVLMALSLVCGYWFHRWEVVHEVPGKEPDQP